MKSETLKLLFGVSSVGLGHVRRSIAIVDRLRRLGSFDVEWITSEPATSFLSACGEKVVPVSRELSSLSSAMEGEVIGGRLVDMSLVTRKSSSIARRNYAVLKEHLRDYDLLVQDEFAETMFSFMWDEKPPLPPKRVIITDFYRFETSSWNPPNRIILWYANRMLARAYENASLRIFADNADSIPERFRVHAKSEFEVVGPIVGKPPSESRESLRSRLYSHLRMDRILLVTIGGTSAGKDLLRFFASNASRITESLRMSIVLLLGPRIDRSTFPPDTEDLEVVPFTIHAPDFFKAADCIVTQAGASTLNEVAAVGTACVAIPISNHWEQEANARRYHQKFGFTIVNYDNLDLGHLVRAVHQAMESEYAPANINNGSEMSALSIMKLGER